MNDRPEPSIEFLKKPYLLIQSWKKTVAYIRYHNWYADTLQIDLASTDLPSFINNLSDSITNWSNNPLLMVPAPKNQNWETDFTNYWQPVNPQNAEKKIRPLAHVNLRDQIVATSIMICLADIVENLQGDPSLPSDREEDRLKVISYGNRLYCTNDKGVLVHHWGSSKLYRSYFQDYQAFLKRPETVIEKNKSNLQGKKIVLVHSDLRQFYDLVSPHLLLTKVCSICKETPDKGFIELVSKVFNWHWDSREDNKTLVDSYKNKLDLPNYDQVALPQGLVASGFFANIVLLDFDNSLRTSFKSEICNGITLLDACRYVDDLRFVLLVEQNMDINNIRLSFIDWIQKRLDESAEGLKISEDKTELIEMESDNRWLIKQSRKMDRIQADVSGGFDIKSGFEVIAAIQGLMRSQSRFAEERIENSSNHFSAVPDVKDETVARFAAHRFRTSYRSLRPMLIEDTDRCETCHINQLENAIHKLSSDLTKNDLDEEAKGFSYGLIENWIYNPSNVRLLRVGLDIWPDRNSIQNIFKLLKLNIDENAYAQNKKIDTSSLPIPTGNTKEYNHFEQVSWYCIAEIFRAGATETGVLEDSDNLPTGIDFLGYRSMLKDEGIRILSVPDKSVPWYVQQQIMLYLMVESVEELSIENVYVSQETIHYLNMIRFLKGEKFVGDQADFARLAILTRRAFKSYNAASSIIIPQLTLSRFKEIELRDPSLAIDLLNHKSLLESEQQEHMLIKQSYFKEITKSTNTLHEVVKNQDRSWINEISILTFSLLFLKEYSSVKDKFQIVNISPYAILIEKTNNYPTYFENISIIKEYCNTECNLYIPANWVEEKNYWKYHLAYLIRFILVGQYDYTRSVFQASWKENRGVYRVPESHWYQRDHGMYNGYTSFGMDWLPTSDWVEMLLYSLLQWPGCYESNFIINIESTIEVAIQEIDKRLKYLNSMYGYYSTTLMMPLRVKSSHDSSNNKVFRACVVQKVLPNEPCITFEDPTISSRTRRACHRNHLSASLAALRRMMSLRESHIHYEENLNLIVFPELSIHQEDIDSHLIPFVRKYKTIIVAGMSYSQIEPEHKLINSALWIMPVTTPSGGVQVITRRQGKLNLSPKELSCIQEGKLPEISPFRPCQWIIENLWDKDSNLLTLSSSICYDATDIRLAADLRNISDLYLIPAFNMDIKTFDNMALALHYHMYQMVIIANNGTYGGSCAFMPYTEDYHREVFHLHGQPQASIVFFEIENIQDFLDRGKEKPRNDKESKKHWKTPPAGFIARNT
jgi:hypothetical protein